ncbi:dTMP kinase [Streptomyces sp. e14]|nr:dTMP kinase [Streptomyces sp. e14]
MGRLNRLAGVTSPYLLQHADNPVDWWPWAPEAFEEARRRDVPILLSVGYSACHWCQCTRRTCKCRPGAMPYGLKMGTESEIQAGRSMSCARGRSCQRSAASGAGVDLCAIAMREREHRRQGR